MGTRSRIRRVSPARERHLPWNRRFARFRPRDYVRGRDDRLARHRPSRAGRVAFLCLSIRSTGSASGSRAGRESVPHSRRKTGLETAASIRPGKTARTGILATARRAETEHTRMRSTRNGCEPRRRKRGEDRSSDTSSGARRGSCSCRPGKIDSRFPLHAMGLDSLMAMEPKSRDRGRSGDHPAALGAPARPGPGTTDRPGRRSTRHFRDRRSPPPRARFARRLPAVRRSGQAGPVVCGRSSRPTPGAPTTSQAPRGSGPRLDRRGLPSRASRDLPGRASRGAPHDLPLA